MQGTRSRSPRADFGKPRLKEKERQELINLSKKVAGATDDNHQDRQRPSRTMPTLATKTAKKTRLAKACQRCRLRKIKCDGNKPCATCDQSGQECFYRAQAARRRRRTFDVVDRSMLRAGLGVQCKETGAFRFYGT
ncbi:hypothetical protein BJY01DRAFT_190792 [Aspergillus pseudoustus]|uniref:Zn(2)-C6 fungal-type domain-containing protein n=1 Tax=Aspergillus pseudoustus TaxID=1810923 RepID=A0ABR4JV44_9EURO